MVETPVLTLCFGIVVFFTLVGLYERYQPNNIRGLVSLSLGVAMLIKFLSNLVTDGTWGLVSVSVPAWTGKLGSAVAFAFFVFPGYAVWRWVSDPSGTVDTDGEQRLYRYRWVFYALSVVMGGVFLLVFVLVIN